MTCALCGKPAAEFLAGHGVCAECLRPLEDALTVCEWDDLHDQGACEDYSDDCGDEWPDRCACWARPCDVCERPSSEVVAAAFARLVADKRRDEAMQLQAVLL